MDMTTSRTAKIHHDFTAVDTLSTPDTIQVKGSALRAGMILVDDLGCPAVALDHKVRAPRNSGAVAFLVNDLDVGGWSEHLFHANRSFPVVAK